MQRGQWLAGVLVATLCGAAAQGQEKPRLVTASTEVADTIATAPDREALHKQFAETMNGVKLVGHFTVVGQDLKNLKEEEYTIISVKKLADGDKWQFKARVKYGKFDVVVPMDLEVKFAGDTPIITLTDFTIPLLGTFSSRVVLYNHKYAGTWTHGKVGGHLFGMIEKLKPGEAAEASEASGKSEDAPAPKPK